MRRETKSTLLKRLTELTVRLTQIRSLLPKSDEFAGLILPWAVERYINQLGARACDPVAAAVKVTE